ncbi:hypothetical protein [Cellvibrio japonicus]|uniref:Uncharacterized protein n=1 Tax=Cellvibrio japonicus (strain Ueda107) TaxID=498211 RepID=B3PDR9_CELJU|nr:hypothetical protein [Cellvibrio japonicus]ACE84875.1 hypothetical protein CJA_3122 [Cellvibrio japonicus Ueda107]QEI13409.1 hypothetical protein FY117_15040 [Cellvibrio japonicus]QEI16983.1 hypothetical protein FY116_15045 [Cellvibrio japonicus]QEI20561.1 hypothetical protein FY115_15040 [Cellvibrio japonicus]
MKEIGLSKDTHNKSSLRDRYNALNQHSLFYRLFHLAPIFLLIFLPVFGYKITFPVAIILLLSPFVISVLALLIKVDKKIDILFEGISLQQEFSGTKKDGINE